jgi:hypothetical protein
MQPPTELDGAKVLFYATLQKNRRPTGNTKHYIGGELVQPVAGLAICQYENAKGFYLFYCDNQWNVITDTYHESIEDAKNQAEVEYEGVSNEWRQISSEGAV